MLTVNNIFKDEANVESNVGKLFLEITNAKVLDKRGGSVVSYDQALLRHDFVANNSEVTNHEQ